MNTKTQNIRMLISSLEEISHSSPRCYHDTCQELPISSHTIPENYLYKLNQDVTKVLMHHPSIFAALDPERKLLKQVKKDQFSTFSGFCEKHDHKLFRSIDEFDSNLTTEIAVLMHYRNICFGINHIETQRKRLVFLAKQDFIETIPSNQEANEAYQKIQNGSYEARLVNCLQEHLKRKIALELMISSKDFINANFLALSGDLENPIFSGRSSYLLHSDDPILNEPGYNYFPWISYMTLRNSNTNLLVFAWLVEDKEKANGLFKLLNQYDARTKLAALAYASSDAFAVEQGFHRKHHLAIKELIMKFRIY